MWARRSVGGSNRTLTRRICTSPQLCGQRSAFASFDDHVVRTRELTDTLGCGVRVRVHRHQDGRLIAIEFQPDDSRSGVTASQDAFRDPVLGALQLGP
jgi:hypothetical protein